MIRWLHLQIRINGLGRRRPDQLWGAAGRVLQAPEDYVYLPYTSIFEDSSIRLVIKTAG